MGKTKRRRILLTQGDKNPAIENAKHAPIMVVCALHGEMGNPNIKKLDRATQGQVFIKSVHQIKWDDRRNRGSVFLVDLQ